MEMSETEIDPAVKKLSVILIVVPEFAYIVCSYVPSDVIKPVRKDGLRT